MNNTAVKLMQGTAECQRHFWPHFIWRSFQSGPLLFLQTGSLDYSFLATSFLSEKRQTLLWLLFFTSFAVKVPMVPVHREPPRSLLLVSVPGYEGSVANR